MDNFAFSNPVKILFGQGQIGAIGKEIPKGARVLLTFGGGSIKTNGVYDQTLAALSKAGFQVVEFGGIEPNPTYETLMKAVELGRANACDFILAVGGGSVLDGSKFIAAAMPFDGDAWDIAASKARPKQAVPLGAILTLPATGSEMNGFAVISRHQTGEKLGFFSPHVYPRFSVLDPTTTYSLPPRQIGNGIVDAFVHVLEQYLTRPAQAPLQDRLAESILATLIEIAPAAMACPPDYQARANLMWCATMALNGLIGQGVPQDWATHMIGHEMTAITGIDHARTLAAVWPGVVAEARAAKRDKLLQFAARVWNLTQGDEDGRIDQAISLTRDFFQSVGVPAGLASYSDLPDDLGQRIADKLSERGPVALGEDGVIDAQAVLRIIQQAAA